MQRKDKIFDAYVDANELTPKINLGGSGLLYVFPGGDSLTKEDIMGSARFAGFTDGFEGHPNRFSGPKGVPEVSREQSPFELVREFMRDSVHGETFRKVLEITPGVGDRIMYEEQYRLGRAHSER